MVEETSRRGNSEAGAGTQGLERKEGKLEGPSFAVCRPSIHACDGRLFQTRGQYVFRTGESG